MNKQSTTAEAVARALRGEAIYGDDFDSDEIAQWFADEEAGYSGLGYLDSETQHYAYSALDLAYFWRLVPNTGMDALGIGSAFGSEFSIIAPKLNSITIVEPATKYWRSEIAGVPTRYIRPCPSGTLPFPRGSFDLVTAFGVLHHIPNVSHVIGELVRTLRPGGYLAIREPIVSMGDWRTARPGLTKRERGLPLQIFNDLLACQGCTPIKVKAIGFGPLLKIVSRFSRSSHWNSPAFVRFDAAISSICAANYTYHRTTFLRRCAPTLGCWLFRKG